jgi:hypothetical protein
MSVGDDQRHDPAQVQRPASPTPAASPARPGSRQGVAAKVRRAWGRGLSSLSAVWCTFAVVVLATLVTAVAGLIAQDLLPKDAKGGDRIVASRMVTLGVLLVLLLGALWLRNQVQRTTGTVFHVQVLDQAMADLRATSRRNAEANRMAVRSITRWVDLLDRTSRPGGVIELADVCDEVSDTLEALINADPIDTGYTLAPVMLWPVALAVGTQLALPGRLRLYELEAREENPTNEIDLDETARPIGTLAVVREGSDPTGRVGVQLAFTEASRFFTSSMWDRFGVTTHYQLTLAGRPPGARVKLTNEDVTGLGAGIAEQLIEIKTANPGRELVVVAMITKIVAVAIGWHLAQHNVRFFHGTHLMHYDVQTRSYIPMRVKQSQPDHAPRAL